MNFEIGPDAEWIRCGLCRMVSYNRNDVLQRYCGNCHLFLEENAMPDEEGLERTITVLEQCEKRLVEDFTRDMAAVEEAIKNLKLELAARKQRPQ